MNDDIEILAWHFSADDGRLNFGERPKVIVGEWMRAEGPLIMCRNGMHASRDPFGALQYAQGSLLSHVECRGEIEEETDKIVCRERKHLWQYDATKELRLFACWCVRETPLHDSRKVWNLLTDERSRNAVIAAERFAQGQATREDLASAKAAAWAAARTAAWDVALAAAWDAASAAARTAAWDVASAAARTAGWAAASAAAWDVAWDAAWDAAWDVASAAARDAAWDVAWAAASAAQKARFNEIVAKIAEEMEPEHG